MNNKKQQKEITNKNTDPFDEYINIDRDLITCELCSRAYCPESFYEHLLEHTRDEVELLRKLSEKTRDMTTAEYDDFFLNLEVETYREVHTPKNFHNSKSCSRK